MNRLKIFKTGAIAFIILGILHLLFQFGPKPNDTALHQLLADMGNYKIKIMGEHSLLKFHNGFSVNMGFLLFAFGIQHFLLAKEILNNKTAFVSTIIITAIIFAMALIYFHVLAYGFVFFSLLCFSISFFKNNSKFKNHN
jgi:hypothetical protein